MLTLREPVQLFCSICCWIVLIGTAHRCEIPEAAKISGSDNLEVYELTFYHPPKAPSGTYYLRGKLWNKGKVRLAYIKATARFELSYSRLVFRPFVVRALDPEYSDEFAVVLNDIKSPDEVQGLSFSLVEALPQPEADTIRTKCRALENKGLGALTPMELKFLERCRELLLK